MINISFIFVCIWSGLMFAVGMITHWAITPKVGYIHIEKIPEEDYDRFSIEFTRDPSELYSLHEVMLKVKYRETHKDNSPDSDST